MQSALYDEAEPEVSYDLDLGRLANASAAARETLLASEAAQGNVRLAVENNIGIFSLGASVLAPILDSGRLRTQQDVAVGRRDQDAFAYRKAALAAFKEVEDTIRHGQ